jgi:hypothetical protein
LREIKKFYETFGKRLPRELWEEHRRVQEETERIR